MAMLDKLLINSIDVTDYRLKWAVDSDWDTSIDSLTVELSPSVTSLLDLSPGLVIELSRGFVTSTDNNIFIGQITQVKPEASIIKLVCKNRMVDAVKSAQTKSWDIDIDTEGGVGSEIFKSICDNSGLDYDSTSIISTGTNDNDKLVKFIQNDEDDFQKMNELADIYNYAITFDYDTEWVGFKPKGYVTYPVNLTVGVEIPSQIKWKENMEQMINKVKIQGATVYDKIPESFAGPATEFTLSKTPEDTEVRINSTTTNDIQTRGQKGVGTVGTDFDYYVDVDQKKLIFSGDVSNVTINYGAQVPLPVVLRNQTSIDTYGGPNKKPHFKKFTFTDIKDINDAENRGRAILSKYSVPFNEAEKVPIIDSVIQTNGDFEPGHLVQITDNFTGKDLQVFVNSTKKSWPHVNDMITVGDQIWKTEDWQSDQMKKINQLFNELNKNQDILIDTTDLYRETAYVRRYAYLETRDTTEDGIWGVGFGNGTIGTLTWGATGALWQSSYTNAVVMKKLNQGQNTYREFIYDDDFKDTVNTTATWNNTTHEFTFTSGQLIQTSLLTLGTAYSYFTLSMPDVTGTITVEISGDGGSTWQTVTLSTRTAFTLSTVAGVKIKITEAGASTATIANTYKVDGRYNLAAVKCILEE